MKRRFFMGLIASLPAACVPTKPSFATKRELNARYGRLYFGTTSSTEFIVAKDDDRRWWPIGQDWRQVKAQGDRERAAIKAVMS